MSTVFSPKKKNPIITGFFHLKSHHHASKTACYLTHCDTAEYKSPILNWIQYINIVCAILSINNAQFSCPWYSHQKKKANNHWCFPSEVPPSCIKNSLTACYLTHCDTAEYVTHFELNTTHKQSVCQAVTHGKLNLEEVGASATSLVSKRTLSICTNTNNTNNTNNISRAVYFWKSVSVAFV